MNHNFRVHRSYHLLLGVGGLLVVGVATESVLLAMGAAAVVTALAAVHSHRKGSSSPEPIPDGGTAEIDMVVAIVRPAKLTDVKRALAEVGAPSLTVTNVSGRGSQPTETGQWRGAEYTVDLHQKVKVECAIPATETAPVVDAIQSAAHTGEPGDGKVFVLPVTGACRVSTDERGVSAL